MPHQEREPLRLTLAPTWLDIPDDQPPAPAPPPPARHAAERSTPRASCSHCGGDLIRSRLLVHEHALTLVTSRRPYRCVDCRQRRWR